MDRLVLAGDARVGFFHADPRLRFDTGYRPSLVDFAASASGFAVITLSIGFLPTLYGAYNRRERFLIAVEARAGQPVDAVTLVESLPSERDELWNEARSWAADIAETHVSYSLVAWFRSPQPGRAWVLAMWTLLDAAALVASVDRNDRAAARFVRTGATCLQEVGRALYLEAERSVTSSFSSDEVNRGLRAANLARVSEALEGADLEEARAEFRRQRQSYEGWAEALARATFAPRTKWCGG